MSFADRVRDALSTDSTDEPDAPDSTAVEGPAAASGVTDSSRPAASNDDDVSAGGSGAQHAETSAGGADAVPDTPDGVAEDYT